MKPQIFKLALFLILLTLFGCRKNIPAGIETTISGKVYDPKTSKPIGNAEIYIQEYEPGGIYPPRPIGIVDSTRTDINGNYQIQFITTGKSTEYRIAFSPGKDYDPMTDPIKLNVGTNSVINFIAVKIHILKARVIVTNNTNPPLRVYTRLFSTVQNRVLSLSADTTFFLRIWPDQSNEIYFNITNVDTPSLYNVRIDTVLFQGFTDTFQRTFQVDPKLFLKRL